MGESVRPRVGRLALLVLAALAATAALALVLAACGNSTATSNDPLVGYWVGADKGSQMTLVEIQKDGDTYKVLANPDRETGGTITKEGQSLAVDTHAVVMTFTPASQAKLDMKFSGSMFKKPVHVTLSRVDETQYKDAAVAYGLVAIRRGLAMWKAGGGKKYPPVKEVTANGLLGKMIAWPVNMFTGHPMAPGTTSGDYVYRPTKGGKSYSLKAYLADGSTLGK